MKAPVCSDDSLQILLKLTWITRNVNDQAQVVAIQRINLYPVDSAIGFPNTYPLDSDLFGPVAPDQNRGRKNRFAKILFLQICCK